MLKMASFLHETVFCTRCDAVSVMLPTGLNHRLVNFYSANLDFEGIDALSDTEKEIFTFLKSKGEKSEDDIISTLGIEPTVLKALSDKEVLIKNSETKHNISQMCHGIFLG